MNLSQQIHGGSGDNIGGDKIIYHTVVNNILIKSAEYQSWLARVHELEEDLAETAQPERRLKKSAALNEAREQLEQFKQDVVRLANIFTKIEINTERLVLAKAHFDAGRLREADAILKAEELAYDQDSLLVAKAARQNELADIESRLKHNAQEYLVKAQLTALQYDLANRFEKTGEYFELALKSVRLPEVLWEYGIFLSNHNQYDHAIQVLNETVKEFRSLAHLHWDYTSLVAIGLNTLGEVHRKKKDFTAAITAYREAQAIFKIIQPYDEKLYYLGTASTLNQSGVIYMENYEYDKASEAFSSALAIFDQMKNIGYDGFDSTLAFAFAGTGSLFKMKKDYANAEIACSYSLTLYQHLAAGNPKEYESQVAFAWNNLGALYLEQEKYAEAGHAFKESLALRRKLATMNPMAYEPVVAEILSNLGIVETKKDGAAAESLLREALEIYQRLVIAQPGMYDDGLASILFNWGHLYVERKDYKQAASFYQEALVIYQRLASVNPQMYQVDVADALLNLATLYRNMNNYTEALPFFLNALDMYRELDRKIPKQFELGLANALAEYGILLILNSRCEEGQEQLAKALVLLAQYPLVPFAKKITNTINEEFLKINKK